MRNKQKEIGVGISKTLLFLWFVLLFCIVSLSAQGPDTLWTRTYGGVEADFGYSVQQTSDSGYIVTGWTWSFGAGRWDVYLIKTDLSGDTLWTKTYGGVDDDVGYSVQQTFDEGYIIVGNTVSFGAGGRDVYLIKTDSLGDTLWTKTYGDTLSEYASSVRQTFDGGYIVAGYKTSFFPGDRDVYLIKTDSLGDTLWTKTYGGTEWDIGYSVQQTLDEGYIIAGYTESFGVGYEDVYLIKTDSLGDTLWTKTYGGTESDEGYSVQQTSDGGYIIAGYTWSSITDKFDIYLVKTNGGGDTIWTRTFGDTAVEIGYSVQETSDGGYIVAGETWLDSIGENDVYVIKTDANGGLLWTKTYGRTDPPDGGYSIQQTFDGGYIIAGYTGSFGAGIFDVWLLRIEPDVGIEEEYNKKPNSIKKKLKVFPNPFVNILRIEGCSDVKVYDLSGRVVAEVKDDWDGRDTRGEEVKAGIYFLKSKDDTWGKVIKLR